MKEKNPFDELNKIRVEEAINKLSTLDLETLEIDNFKNLIKSSFKLIPFHKHFLLPGQKLFRARINYRYSKFTDKLIVINDEKDFINVSEISNRKAHEITEFGRANIPGVSSFYCSSNLKLACAEVIQDIKHSFNPKRELPFVTVGEWIIKKPIIVAPLFYSQKVTSVRKDIDSYVNRNKEYMKSKYSFESMEIHDMILTFFSDQFTKIDIKSHHDYKISAFYSEILSSLNDYDGILYQSVIANFSGTNICLFDNKLNSKIEINNVYKVMCANIDFNSNIPKFGTLLVAEKENIDRETGEINWKESFRTI